jgi:hypothetical protein
MRELCGIELLKRKRHSSIAQPKNAGFRDAGRPRRQRRRRGRFLGILAILSRRTQAGHHHHYPPTGKSCTQCNSGDPAPFAQYLTAAAQGTKPTPRCYGAHVWGSVDKGINSDSYASGSQAVCLGKY